MSFSAPPPVAPITVEGLTKHFGRGTATVTAVSDLTFSVAPGHVTGFLGPNGSGKTTTLRCLLGLVSASSGRTLINGRAYSELDDPIGTVGSALEASGFHPGRSGRNHLRVVAAAAGIAPARCDEVIDLVALGPAADRRAGEYSMGMRQRLLLAEAMLGDPSVLVLDEPANGLDPGGIAWLRQFLRAMASQGRTVLVSSHVLSEVEQTVDDVFIIREGALVTAGSLADLVERHAGAYVRVAGPELGGLLADLGERAGVTVARDDAGDWRVRGLTAAQVGGAAHAAGVELHELSSHTRDLEEVFLELTAPAAAAPVVAGIVRGDAA